MNALTLDQWAWLIGGMLIILAMGIYIHNRNRNGW